MASPLLGEFMGTMVLILLGDGVVANVLLKRTKAEGAGWMVITSGWAFAVMAGIFTAVACGSRDAHINPAVTLGFAFSSGTFAKVLCRCPTAGRVCRRDSGVALFLAALGRDSRSRRQAGMLLHHACYSQLSVQLALRSDRNLFAGAGGGRHVFQGRECGWAGRRFRSLPGGQPGVGHRAVTRRHHRLRH